MEKIIIIIYAYTSGWLSAMVGLFILTIAEKMGWLK